MWVRRTRLTLSIALLISLVILAWLAGHPKLYSGHVGRVLTRHLLADFGLTFSCRDMGGNPLQAMRFYDVVVTHDGSGGEFAYLSCDSLDVRYELNSFFAQRIVLPEVTLYGPRLSVRQGEGGAGSAAPARRQVSDKLDLEISRIRVRNGEIDVQVGEVGGQRNFRALELEAALSLRAGTTRLRIEELGARWPGGAYEELHLRADCELRNGQLRAENITAQLDSLTLRADANFVFGPADRRNWNARVQARNFDLQQAMLAIGKDVPVHLRCDGAAELRAEGDGLTVEGNGIGQLLHYGFDLDRFSGRVHRDGMEIDAADGIFQGTAVQVGGSVDTANKHLRLSGRAAGFDLSREWKEGERRWPATELEGEFTLDLDLEGEQELRIVVADGRGSLRDIEVDSLRTQLRILPAQGVEIQFARALCNDTRLEVSGAIDTTGVAALALRAEAESGGRWMTQRWPQWTARGIRASGRLEGPLASARLDVEGQVDSATGPQLAASGLVFHLDWPAISAPLDVGGELQCSRLALRELPLGAAQAQFRRRGQSIEVFELAFAQGDSSLRASGRVELEAGLAELELDSLALRLGEVLLTLPEASRVHVGDGRLGSPRFQLVGERGSLLLEGEADLHGALDLRLELHGFDLALLRWARLSPFECAGVLNGTLVLSGHSDSPRALLDFELSDGQWRAFQADSLRTQLVAEGRELRVNSLELQDPQGRLRAAGSARFGADDWLAATLRDPASFLARWPEAELEATVAAQGVELEHWLPAAMQSSEHSWGTLRSRLDLYGTAREPRITGDVQLADIRTAAVLVPELSARIESDAGGVRFRNGVIATDHPWAEFSGEWPLVLSAAARPRRLAGEDLQVRLSSPGEVDLAPLAALFPAISAAQGAGRFDFVATGDPRQPQLTGEVSARGTLLRLRDLSEEFRDIELQGVFRDNQLECSRIFARQGERGELTATATVRFLGLRPDDIDASIDISRMLLLSVPDLRAIVSSRGPVTLSLERPVAGGPRVPHFTGSLRVDRARYTGEFTAAGGAGTAALAATSTPPWTADLRLALRDQIRISNSVAELLISGDIDLTRDLSGLRLRGAAEISTGRVSVARLLDFEISAGRLDFSRGTNLEPIIEITAETDVPVYEQNGVGRELEHVTVRVSGTFAHPVLAFESDSGYDEKTIINLLAGIPIDSGTAEEAQLQALALRMAGKELTGALAERIGGIDTIDLQTQDPGAEGNQARIGLGKYLDIADKPLYLRYTQGFSIAERDVYLEYQLRRRFLLTFEVRRRLREAVAHTELNADLKFRIEY